MHETITEGKDESDDNVMTLAEQYEKWRAKYDIVDEEEEEERGGDGQRSEIHTPDWVEIEMDDIKAERWYRQKVDNVEEESKEEKSCIQEEKVDKETRKQEKRLRIARRRENSIEKEKRRCSGRFRYFHVVSAKHEHRAEGETEKIQNNEIASIPRTQQVHEKTGIGMLYWEQEIAAYRTTKKGFACGMY